MARIEAASGQWTLLRQGYGGQAVDSGQYGKKALNVGDEVRAGDRIVTGEGGRVKLAYVGEETWVDLTSNAECQARNAEFLELRKGSLTAHVEKRSALVGPFVVETPHAKVEVLGTRFSVRIEPPNARASTAPGRHRHRGTEEKEGEKSAFGIWHSAISSTCLQVEQGLVRLTRLLDSAFVDVAAGQYAVAAEGVELVALALAARPVEAAGIESPAILKDEDCPKPRTRLDGKILFEDDFDGPPVNWEVVIGDRDVGYDVVTTNPERYWKMWSQKTRRSSLNWIIVNPDQEGGGDRKRFVGLRSLRPIEAERFVVEARMAFQHDGPVWIPAIEMLVNDSRLLAEPEKRERIPTGLFFQHRWEFEPAQDSFGNGVFVCRRFLNGKFHETARVTPITRKLFFSYSKPQMCIDRIVIRELLAENR